LKKVSYPTLVKVKGGVRLMQDLGMAHRQIVQDVEHLLNDSRQEGILTGIWSCNDGGTYYIRHVADEVWWAGLSSAGPANAFYGRFGAHYGRFSGRWADVPRGGTMEYGDLVIDVISSTRLGRAMYTGRFPGSLWTKIR
jgi:hypothetical protein